MPSLFRLLGCLPLPLLHGLGVILGWAAWLASPGLRRHLAANFGRACGQEAARRLLPAAVGHFGKGIAELPRVWMRGQEEVKAMVREVRGWERVEAAWARGEGILFLTPHLGSFEMIVQYLGARLPTTVLYRVAKHGWLQRLIEEGRGGGKVALAPSDLGGVRQLLRALKRREAVLILPDQVPGFGEGEWVDFFGRPAYTMTLAARMTQATPAALLLLWAERLPGGAGFRVHVSGPREPVAGTPRERALAINREVEALIRSEPAQYLWGYNRYKVPAGARPPGPPC